MNYDKEKFIIKANIKHNFKYNYMNVDYKNTHTKISILCPKHGEFIQLPLRHIRGQGCPTCGIENNANTRRFTQEEFILKCQEIHKNFYDYQKTIYSTMHKKIIVICPTHGEFSIRASNHYRGKKCPYCAGNKNSTNFLIEQFKLIHGNLYDYSKVTYLNSRTKIKIICKTHGEFLQSHSNHLKGNGCPLCNLSKGELQISKWLKLHNIDFERNKKFVTCVNKKQLPFDFYIQNYNTLIEFDGIQHFEKIDYWDEHKLERTQKNDSIKTKWALDNNIRLLRIKYTDNVETILNEYIGGMMMLTQSIAKEQITQ